MKRWSMTTDEKIDLLVDMVADIYSVAERLASRVGLELIRPVALEAYLTAQEAKGKG